MSNSKEEQDETEQQVKQEQQDQQDQQTLDSEDGSVASQRDGDDDDDDNTESEDIPAPTVPIASSNNTTNAPTWGVDDKSKGSLGRLRLDTQSTWTIKGKPILTCTYSGDEKYTIDCSNEMQIILAKDGNDLLRCKLEPSVPFFRFYPVIQKLQSSKGKKKAYAQLEHAQTNLLGKLFSSRRMKVTRRRGQAYLVKGDDIYKGDAKIASFSKSVLKTSYKVVVEPNEDVGLILAIAVCIYRLPPSSSKLDPSG